MRNNKGGRPRKELKKDMFEKLCSIMCTENEICGFFGVTDKTLTRWCKENYGMGFSDAFKVLSADGRISLRRAQFRLAERSAAMAIFLGKNILGQTDNVASNDIVEQIEKANYKVKSLADLMNKAQPSPSISDLLMEASELEDVTDE